MPCGVYTHEVVGESNLTALYIVPERLHVLAVQQLGDHLVVGPLARGPGRDITLQAARVVAEADLTSCGRIGVVEDRIVRSASEIGEDWAKVDRPPFHGTRCDASTPGSMGNVDQWSDIGRDAVARLVCAAKFAIAAERGL